MSETSAREFVARMKEDRPFREAMTALPTGSRLQTALRAEGFDFDQVELVRAMAACMAELEQLDPH